jgi:amino acid adenylation domain-containing protein
MSNPKPSPKPSPKPGPIEDAYPLSHLQAGMLFHSEYAPESAVYHDVISYRIALPYDARAAQQAVEQVVERHEVLRTSIDMTRFSQPLQIVHRKVHVPVKTEDLRAMGHEPQQRWLKNWLEEETGRRFQWDEAPLLRIYVHWLDDTSFQWTLSFHHAILDGWSEASLVTELLQRYQKLSRGEVPSVEKLRVRYRDYVALERQAIESEESRKFWEHLLEGYNPTPAPFSEARKLHEPSSAPRQLAIELKDEEWADLRKLAVYLRVPLKTMLLAAHLKTMSVLGGTSDVITGVVMNGRPEVQGGELMLGLFLNVVPVRLKIERGSWSDLIRATLAVEQRIMPHRWYPMALLKHAHGAGRELFESAFAYLHFHVYKQLRGNGKNVILQRGGFARQSLQFQVAFEVISETDGVRSFIEYGVDRVSEADGRRIAVYYAQALRAMIGAPAASHDAGTLLPESECRQLVEEWNQTQREYARGQCVQELVEAQVMRTPKAAALVYEDRQLTYEDLNLRANHLAWRLKRLGAGPEVRVGICMERSLEMVVALLGVLKSGAAYVPLDPSYPADRLRVMIEDSALSIMILHGPSKQIAQAKVPQVVDLSHEWDRLTKESDRNPPVCGDPENLAYVIYTSGSTGKPKGVAVSHRAVCNQLCWMASAFHLSGADRFLHKASLSFDVSIEEILAPLAVGALVVAARAGGEQDVEYLANVIEKQGITCVDLPPSLLQPLVDHSSASTWKSVRLVTVGGDVLNPDSVKSLRRVFSGDLLNLYGPTETTVQSTVADVAVDLAEPANIPIGRPIANTQVYVLDEHSEVAPMGVSGELYIGGAGLARGYLGRPELTAERFVPDRFSPIAGSRCYWTGDRAKWTAAGELEFLGRLDQQVKVRGFRIELREIEALLETHPNVQEAVVVVQDIANAEKQLVGYVVARAACDLCIGELREYLRGKLSAYMVPGVIVLLDKLPLNANGKVDRRKLPGPQEAGARLGLQSEYVAPRSALEEIVCGIWGEVLRAEQVGVHDNFFELGGHSLSATQLVLRVRRSLQVDLPLRQLFEFPTVAGMAGAIAAGKRTGRYVLPMEWASRPKLLPLSYAQRRLWFIDQLEPGSTAYNMSTAVPLKGELHEQALQRAVQTIVCRHEVLRTHFSLLEGEPVQVIEEDSHIQVVVVSLQGLEADEQVAAIRRSTVEEGATPFDLSNGPLLRVKVLKTAEQEHVLLLSMHHIVSDGWSIEIFLRELSALYGAYRKGEEIELDELPVHYADFALWQARFLEEGALEEQLSYWRKQLQGAAGILELRTDFRRPAVKGIEGGERRFVLGGDTLAALKKLSREAGATLFMTLLAGTQALLWRYTGQADISIGTPIAGRNHEGIEGLIGFFVNMLVIRTGVRGDEIFVDHLRRVREVALGAYEHQDVPFEKLVETMQPDRDPSRTQLFQVTFALENAGGRALELEGLKTGAATRGVTVSNYDLSVEAHEFEKGLVLLLRYDIRLFAPETIERMGSHLQELFERLAQNRAARIADLTRMNHRERRQVLEEWNHTAFEYDREKCVHELFEERARQAPSAVAVVYEGGELSCGDLNSRASQLANFLRKAGVRTESPVALFVERGMELVVGMLGILKAGGAYVPLDPASPPERLRHIIEDAQISILLTQLHLLERLPKFDAHVICIDHEWRNIEKESTIAPPRLATPGSLMYTIYTSGSTGKPKGVMVEHQSVMNHMAWMLHEFPLTPSTRLLQKTSLAFDASVWEFFAPWMTGARSVLLPPGKQDTDVILRTILSQGITRLQFIPSALKMLMGCLDFEGQTHSLREVFCGGEMLTSEIASEFFERHTAQLHNIYGPTETTIISTFFRIRPGQVHASSVPIGKPIANTQLYILDSELEPLPIGVAGELYIGGAGVARGYVNRPELTAERFVPDPFSGVPGARLYRVGDLVRYLPDGNVEFLGRMDQQVKIRGFRVELGEIEATILESSAIESAVVTLWNRGTGIQELVAYVVSRDRQHPVDTNALRLALANRLPDYMVPHIFMVLDAMPLNENGKVDHKKLPVAQATDADHDTYAPPKTATEEALCKIWAEVLDIERVGIHDNFFELGGHSMLATYAQQQVRKVLQVEMPVRTFFDSPTVAEFAEKLDSRLQERSGERRT